MQKYALKMLDGSVSIMTIISGEIDSEINKMANKDDVLDYIQIFDQDIPTDRYFRNAWEFSDNTGVRIDFDKAKEIKKEEFRVLRAPLLEQSDIDFMKALEQGQDTSAIVAKKQELRDVTLVELPDNLTDLRDFIPEVLK